MSESDSAPHPLVVHCRRESYQVYVGRPSEWGNPYSHLDGTLAEFRVETREQAVACYREWLLAQPELVARVRQELAGKRLGCWCGPRQACHAKVLARLANPEPESPPPPEQMDLFASPVEK